MKKHAVHILIIAGILAIGIAYRYQRTATRRHAEKNPAPLQTQADNVSKPYVRSTIPALPKPVAEKPKPKTSLKIVAPKGNGQPKPETAKNRAAMQYWNRAAQRFEQQGRMLGQEKDPGKRMNLIRAMARNVRIDTPVTLDWAMSLDNPEERQMAMEAINNHALTGIGARLEMGETGLPRIKETTVLSAIASTGLVEPGDYIAGMMKNDGTTIYFKNRPIREIVNRLHGKAGTEVHLLMERASDDGSEPYSFDVSVQRSLIVVQPPF